MTITGSNLAGATAVMFGRTAKANTFKVISDTATEITAVSPPGTCGDGARDGGHAGRDLRLKVSGRSVQLRRPVVTGINPSQGPAAGGTT